MITNKQLFLSGSVMVAALVVLAQSAAALAQTPTYSFDIPAKDLGRALRAYSEAYGRPIAFDDEATHGKQTAGPKGEFTARKALDRLLRTYAGLWVSPINRAC